MGHPSLQAAIIHARASREGAETHAYKNLVSFFGNHVTVRPRVHPHQRETCYMSNFLVSVGACNLCLT